MHLVAVVAETGRSERMAVSRDYEYNNKSEEVKEGKGGSAERGRRR